MTQIIVSVCQCDGQQINTLSCCGCLLHVLNRLMKTSQPRKLFRRYSYVRAEYAQELLDMFYLKSAEMNWMKAAFASEAIAGYTNGMLMTLGGVDAFGKDAWTLISHDTPAQLLGIK